MSYFVVEVVKGVVEVEELYRNIRLCLVAKT